MNIMLGNLSVEKIEERLGIKFPDELVDFMKKNHQSRANNIAKGKWHCFDIPFELVCGDYETARKIFDYLKHQHENCKTSLRISVNR